MKTIIHICKDFPDPLVPGKTRANERLIASATGFRHVVYSLNRVNWRTDVAALAFGDDRIAIAYGAPPYGMRLTRSLAPVTGLILRDMTHRGIRPDLVHAHKFAVEGLVAADLAEQMGCPFIASVWGDTDIKIVATKPRLRRRYRAIGHLAALLLPAAPWTADEFRNLLGLDGNRFEVLPLMTNSDAILPPKPIGVPRLASMFWLDSYRRKGFDLLVRAIARLAAHVPDLTVDVYGRGSPKAFLDMTRMINAEGVHNRVCLKGALPHGEVQQVVNQYAAFVLPSRRETYGMVYVEALLAGTPILWSQRRGIDGLLDGLDAGYRCDPSSPDDIAAGIGFLLDNEQPLKHALARHQAAKAFEHLRSGAIASRYGKVLARLLD
jgi:glycosyltransferase involved in cell wall biosynthesis